MKTHLLVLEAHDDLVSVRDRMSWAKTPRILLVWPVGTSVNLRPVDLKLLDRQARSLGARLGLMTRDRAVRREAAALGLPVFRSSAAAQRDHWPVPVKRTFRVPRRVDLRALRESARPGEARWKSSLIARVLFFALGVAAALAIVALFVPRAEIVLSPETETQSLTVPVIADPSLDIVFITGSIPAREWTREAEGSAEVVATGSASVPKSEAEGVARFSNLTGAPVPIPAGTVVQTLDAPPVRFVTLQETQVAAGAGKFVEVPIRAVNAGARGNREAGAVTAIEGPLGLSLTVTNPKPTEGGSDKKVPAPSEADRERARREALQSLPALSQSESREGLPAGSIILPDTEEAETLEETYDPPAGETGATLAVRLRVK
ncbi:MAG: baseplate J/gp47 family protein, partial [Chloroflexota bacterium]